jgi:peptide chain release factor 1
VYNLPEVMDGRIEEFISSLRMAENLDKMQAGGVE